MLADGSPFSFELTSVDTLIRDYFDIAAKLTVTLLLSGDYNSNGVVDAPDYIVWRDTFGQEVMLRTGADGNGNGIVDAPDYTLWRENFGNTAGASVPEPSSILLLLPAAVAFCWRRRR